MFDVPFDTVPATATIAYTPAQTKLSHVAWHTQTIGRFGSFDANRLVITLMFGAWGVISLVQRKTTKSLKPGLLIEGSLTT